MDYSGYVPYSYLLNFKSSNFPHKNITIGIYYWQLWHRATKYMYY